MIQKPPQVMAVQTLCSTKMKSSYQNRLVYVRGAQIPGTSMSGTLNFVEWCLMFVSPQYGTCLVSRTWHLNVLPTFLESLHTLGFRLVLNLC